MISYIRTISRQRAAWLLLAASALAFELCGLFFQHVMGLAPCVMCVYERLAFVGIFVAALIALVAPEKPWLRWPAMLLWTYSAFRGLQLSLKHVDYQLNPSPFNTCSLFAEFPAGCRWISGCPGCSIPRVIAPSASGPSSVGRCPNGWS